MKSIAPPRVAILFVAMILVSLARQARADMWCGNGPGTALSHPCTDDDDNPAVSAAIEKYQDQWMKLDGVYEVDDGDTYHNRVPSIVVHVDAPSLDPVRKQIPTSVDGIPVVIVHGKMPDAGGGGAWGVGCAGDGCATDPEEVARRARKQEEQARAEKSYNMVLHHYGERWDDLPGVLGMGPKCNHNGCDFNTIEISVQRELLSQARGEIPSSANGVRIVVTPDD
ncbi:MAG: hypothetical protein WAU33_15525 [Candidatus Binataceae bacterium]